MGLERAIEHGKEHRQPYRGAARFDVSCRNHGGCVYCRRSRTISRLRIQAEAKDQLKSWPESKTPPTE